MRDKILLLLLLMCVVQFFGAWVYPAYQFGGVALENPTKTLGVPFQYTLWAFIVLISLHTLRERGSALFMTVLAPFAPLIVVGLVAGAFGIDPIGSVRMLILWTLMAFSAVVIGVTLPPERLLRALLTILFVILSLSVLWAVFLPAYGTMGGETGQVWRGLFLAKNAFGWVAALVMVLAISAYRPGYRRLPAATILVALVCLLFSGSKGALVAAVAAATYGFCVPRLMRRVTPGFGIGIVLVGGLCALVFIALALPLILDLLGRDITLTGRTSIWKTYFLSMSDTPWLGLGPGAYTKLSPVTSVLAARLSNFGSIVTPHSIFLGVLGDGGLFGLVAFLGLMTYVTLIAPAVRRGHLWMLSGNIGFLILVAGLVETHEVFSPGPGWFLLILLRAMAMHQDSLAPAPTGSRAAPPSGTGMAHLRRQHTPSF